jgi:hypothetical protein
VGGNEFGCGGAFAGARFALKGDAIGLVHGVAVLNADGEGFGHVEGEAVVEQRQGSKRCGRVRTFWCDEGNVGKIEVIEDVDYAGAGLRVFRHSFSENSSINLRASPKIISILEYITAHHSISVEEFWLKNVR